MTPPIRTRQFTLWFRLKRRFWCSVFHREHMLPTPIAYAKATGLDMFCNKCYRMARTHGPYPGKHRRMKVMRVT